MDRRSFIKLTAISGTTAALASCGNPEHQLIRFVPDEDIVPGQAVWKPSVCPLCAAGCGLTVRVMDADADVVRNGQAGVVQILAAKKLEGNPAHPVNRGGLCARGQAAIQVTYHPDRITQPLKRTGDRGDGALRGDHLGRGDRGAGRAAGRAAGRRQPESLAFLGRARRSSHRAALIDQFLARFGAPRAVTLRSLRRRRAAAGERAQLRRGAAADVRSGERRYVINFGADLLGTWNSPVSQSRAYGDMRQGRPRRPRPVRAGRSADVADRRERGRVGRRSSRAPKACSRSASRT